MTSEEKSALNRLRAQGLGYKRIAKETGISENTVKSYFRRMPNPIPTPEKQREEKGMYDRGVAREGICRFCGKSVVQAPGRREKKFCSDTCRMRWWNRHRTTNTRKSVRTVICQSCGAEFPAYGTGIRKYCSHDCYIAGRFHGVKNGKGTAACG